MMHSECMTSTEAIELILEYNLVESKYRLAKLLDTGPIMVDNYLKGVSMSPQIAKLIWFMFDIHITNPHVRHDT